MKNRVWANCIKACANPQGRSTSSNSLAPRPPEAPWKGFRPNKTRILAALFSGSQALSNSLVSHPDWLSSLEPALLAFPRRKEGLSKETRAWLKRHLEGRDYGAALTQLRQFKNREMMRWLRAISPGSGMSLRSRKRFPTWLTFASMAHGRFAACDLGNALGLPYHQDANGRWQPTNACVCGLGKLGGRS